LADRLTKIVEDYFAALHNVHRLGAGTDERSYYPAVASLLNAIGSDLRPRVHAISDLGNTDEAAYVSKMVRRIAAILLMGPRLDKNYADSKDVAVEWKDGAPRS
jgi:hypothetical protein